MDRGRDGRRSRKPGARACRCGQSNGSWASTGPPSGVIWRPEVLQDGSSGWCPIRRYRIPWQRNGVTFSLNTYPDIFPDLRHPVVRFAAALDRSYAKGKGAGSACSTSPLSVHPGRRSAVRKGIGSCPKSIACLATLPAISQTLFKHFLREKAPVRHVPPLRYPFIPAGAALSVKGSSSGRRSRSRLPPPNRGQERLI